MSSTEVIEEIERLPVAEQQRVAEYLAKRFPSTAAGNAANAIREKTFDEAAERVFRENRELFRRLAQ
jgi:hypothetical protein